LAIKGIATYRINIPTAGGCSILTSRFATVTAIEITARVIVGPITKSIAYINNGSRAVIEIGTVIISQALTTRRARVAAAASTAASTATIVTTDAPIAIWSTQAPVTYLRWAGVTLVTHSVIIVILLPWVPSVRAYIYIATYLVAIGIEPIGAGTQTV
jgi:hypothetical protein